MKRLALVLVGLLLGLGLAVAVLAMFVVRPEACGEPAACGDDYLYPALPAAAIVLLSGVTAGALTRYHDRSPTRSLVQLSGVVVAVSGIVVLSLLLFA